VGFAVGRTVVQWLGERAFHAYWLDQGIRLRRNLLAWLLEAPGSRLIEPSPGEAISTFRDDIDDVLRYLESYLDALGMLLYIGGAVTIMAFIEARLTIIVLVPLLAALFAYQAMSPQIRTRRRAMRRATDAVTGFIGETFSSIQVVKLADADQPILRELRRRNETRHRAALRDTLLTELLRSLNVNMANISTAIVLIVGAGAISEGTFTVGELALFIVYLPRLTSNMAFLGDALAQHRRTGVSWDRVHRLSVDAVDDALLDSARVPLVGQVGELPPRRRQPDDQLQRLRVNHLTHTHPNGAIGISDISFSLERDSFTVITGRIGAGKTTLVRSILGLLPAEGTVVWNDHEIVDRASFLVPPRSAYTPQVPRLFSDTLALNIAVGEELGRTEITDAAGLAVLDHDLHSLPHGIDTMVGARGVKLSGGQVQRSAAARMFATRADLLVFDDLSSALDVHTENELWERLFARRDVTCLVVSHRLAALERADQILVLEHGRLVDRGSLAELLDRSPTMRELVEMPS